MRRTTGLVLLLVSLAALLVPSHADAQGQSVYGAITGAITDPSGAAVPNAKVIATNVATAAPILMLAMIVRLRSDLTRFRRRHWRE